MKPLSDAATISKQEVVAASQGQFLRLSDEKPGEKSDTERMTVGEAAEKLSGVFGKGTCGAADQPDAYQTSSDPNIPLNQGAADYLSAKYPGSAGIAELADKFGVPAICPATMTQAGPRTFPVYVHASSDAVFEDYRIVAYGSPLSGPQIIEEDIQLRFEFTRSASLPIRYYINYEKLDKYLEPPSLYSDMFEWRGRPKNNRGVRVDPPEVTIHGGQVLLHGYYSGILIVRRLPIKYHKYMLTVIGTALGDGRREYKGRVSAISSAYNLGPVDQQVGETEVVKDKSAECPIEDTNPLATDPISGDVIICRRNSSGGLVCSGGDENPKGKDIFCFIEVRKQLLQQCTDNFIRNLPTEYRQVSCPDPVIPTWNMGLSSNPALPEYYHRVKTIFATEYSFEGTSPQITDDEYEEICCHAPVRTGCVPYCREIKSTYYGPVEIEGGRQKYIDQYPGKTVFIPVGTEAGPCGTLTEKFVDPGLDCGCHYNESRLVVNFLLGKLEYKIDDGEWIDIGGNRSIFYLPTESISVRLTKTVALAQTAVDYKIFAGSDLIVEDSYDETTDRLPCESIDGILSPPTEWVLRELRFFGSKSAVDSWVLSFGYPSASSDFTSCSSPGFNGWQGLQPEYKGYYIRWDNEYGVGDIGKGERVVGAWCKGRCPDIGAVVYERTIEAVC